MAGACTNILGLCHQGVVGMLGVVLVVLGVVWLLVQCGLGLPPLAEAMTLDPVV
ncbi:hypothetical protein D1O90_005534, partial [Escherichia coli]|nr:hypothetical protein [Escherichia coli]